MAKRKYKRDSRGRFKGGGGGPGGRKARAKKLAIRVAKSPLTYQVLATVAVGAVANKDAANFAAAMGSAKRAAYNQNAARVGIGAGSAMLKAAKRRNGVYKL